jgi:hypothetical protein
VGQVATGLNPAGGSADWVDMTPLRWTLVAAWIAIGIWAGFADDWQLVPEASSSQDVTEIRQVITHDTLASDPNNCTERETPRLVMQGESGTYEEALAECREDEADKNAAETGGRVEISEIEVDGDTAQATVTAPDGELSMFTLRLDLLRANGTWKIDYIAGIEIDRPAFDAVMAERAADSTFTAAERDCILSRQAAVPTQEVERQILEDQSALSDNMKEFAILCMRGTRLSNLLAAVLQQRAVEDGVPVRYADCFTREFLSRVPRSRIRDTLATGRDLPSKYCVASARACATEYPAAALANASAS